jgi:hypothetical protein
MHIVEFFEADGVMPAGLSETPEPASLTLVAAG